MTKTEEIESLRKFLNQLPESGYIRPWLESQTEQITNAMRSDYPIDVYAMSSTEFHQAREAKMHEAEHQARVTIAKAERDAAQIIQRAESTEQQIQNRLADALGDCRRALGY